MDVRVITLRYQDALQGFSEEALRKAISGREVLEAREHFLRTATCREDTQGPIRRCPCLAQVSGRTSPTPGGW